MGSKYMILGTSLASHGPKIAAGAVWNRFGYSTRVVADGVQVQIGPIVLVTVDGVTA